MTEERYKRLLQRLDALERLILGPAATGSKQIKPKRSKKKVKTRRRLDSL